MKRAQIGYTYEELAKQLGFKNPDIALTGIVDDPKTRRVTFLVDENSKPGAVYEVGDLGLLDVANAAGEQKLYVGARITAVIRAYGRQRLEVTPTNGSGTMTVNAERVRLSQSKQGA